MAYFDIKSINSALQAGNYDTAGVYLYVYGEDTETFRPIYSDTALSRTTANPIQADSNGVFEKFFVHDGKYRIVVMSQKRELLFEANNIYVSTPFALGYAHTFGSYNDLIEDDVLSYVEAVGRHRVNVGDIVHTTQHGSKYKIADASASDQHLQTLGGLKLYVLPNNDGHWDVRAFGAVGDGVAIDENASIQAAVDTAHAAGGGAVLIPSGTFNVNCAVPHILEGEQTQYGVHSISLLDRVKIIGSGTLRLQDSAYGPGALFRVIASSSSGISDAGINGITIDGNAANQVPNTQANNILLHPLSNVHVSNIKSINANGSSIQLVAPSGSLGQHIMVRDNVVDTATNIGIQVTGFAGLTISGNSIKNCTDNGIDIYGDDGTTVTGSHNFSITNNTVDGALVGIFPETVRDGTVAANAVRNCNIGMVCNRINGAPENIVYSGNTVTDCPTGWRGTGDTNGILVTGNTFKGFDLAGVTIGGASGNASYMNIEGNSFNPATETTPILSTGNGALSFCQFHGNSVLRNYDISNAFSIGTGSQVACRFEEPFGATAWNADLKNIRRGILLQSGEGTTIPIPPNAAGTITMRGSAGGAWRSVWTGTFISNASSVKLTELSSSFITPGNFFASVVGGATALEIYVEAATSGSPGRFDYSMGY